MHFVDIFLTIIHKLYKVHIPILAPPLHLCDPNFGYILGVFRQFPAFSGQ